MIAIEALVKPTQKKEVDYPVATDEQVERVIDAIISHEVDYVTKPFRASSCYGHTLFTLTPEQFTNIGNPLADHEQKFKVEPERAQRVGLDVMRRYGFDQEAVGVKEEKEGRVLDYEMVTTIYPSRTVKGLVFERHQTLNSKNNEVYKVIWCVNNRVALIKFNPIQALRKRSQG